MQGNGKHDKSYKNSWQYNCQRKTDIHNTRQPISPSTRNIITTQPSQQRTWRLISVTLMISVEPDDDGAEGAEVEVAVTVHMIGTRHSTKTMLYSATVNHVSICTRMHWGMELNGTERKRMDWNQKLKHVH